MRHRIVIEYHLYTQCTLIVNPCSSLKLIALAHALAFALTHVGRKRVHDSAEMMAAIVAGELVDQLERAGFVIMQRPPIGGGAALGRGFER